MRQANVGDTISRNLRFYRRKRHLTQGQLAKYLHADHQMISKYERVPRIANRMSVGRAKAIADVLEIGLDDLTNSVV
jgi:transcriptional regulator with XRE-family HTH domain